MSSSVLVMTSRSLTTAAALTAAILIIGSQYSLAQTVPPPLGYPPKKALTGSLGFDDGDVEPLSRKCSSNTSACLVDHPLVVGTKCRCRSKKGLIGTIKYK